MIRIVPEALPATVGLNVPEMFCVAPGAIENDAFGVANGPVVVIELTLSVAVPVLVIANVLPVLVVPTRWLPKSCDDGLTLIAGATPVPETLTAVGVPGSFEAIEIVPFAAPVAVGENRPVNVTLLLGAIVAGNVGGVTANGLAVEIDVTTRSAVPWFAIVKV